MLKRLLSLVVFSALVSLIGANSAGAAVWDNSSSWSSEREQAYHQWVEEYWDKDFFVRSGPYQGLKQDCADTVYAMRIVFAAEHGLPFAMKDPTGSGVISNSMKRFDHLPRSQRPREFLKYVYDVVSTASIPNDTYPVAVSRKGIGSGRLILTDSRNHHSWTIKYVSRTGVPYLLFSSRPAKSRLFERFEYPSREFTFVDGLKPERHAGFRAFRRPEHALSSVWEVPGYSLEQYQLPFKGWSKHVQKRLQLNEETAGEHLRRTLTEACRGAGERVEAVNDGLRALDRNGHRCLSSSQFDDHSTPSRDKRLKAQFQELASAYKKAVENGSRVDSTVRAQADSVMSGKGGGHAYCQIEIARGYVMSLGEIYSRSIKGRLSSNPHDSVGARWGLESHPGSLASRCPVY